MRAHYLQHVPFEGLGSMESWLTAREWEITRTCFFESDSLPDPAGIDLLIVMGGPMSVNDEGLLPWLVKEKQFIKTVIESGLPVLGVCLGAQLIASAMGSAVFQNKTKEIGWFPITGTAGSDPSSFRFPDRLDVFHWHGETFDLPEGASRLASSAVCKNQAFRLGNKVIGLQFHLETTPESAQNIVTHCRDELVPAPYIQTEKQILTADSKKYEQANQWMDKILSFITAAD